MRDELLPFLLTGGLWVLIVGGWILLVTIGLEVDKPLSGGIPGHVAPEDEHTEGIHEGLSGRIGVAGSWIVFGLATLSLPVIFYWIMAVHRP